MNRTPSRPWLILAAGCVVLAGCSPGARQGLPAGKLDAAIGRAIGDPATCLLIADAASRRVVYTYGEAFNCGRGLPACDRPGLMSARSALALAATPGGRDASCASNADGSRSVGWNEAPVAGSAPALVYSAVMEGQDALPGREMAARLADAFSQAGIGSAAP